MEKEYYRRYEPFFGEWRLGRFIGAGSYGKVFEIERRDALGTVSTSAMKALTIPSSQDELDAILASGMDEEGVSDYFQKYVDDIKKEIALMQRLKGHSTIVSYEDHRAYPHPDGRGWDILIRMELLRPINDDLRRQKIFTRAEVLRLGIDLCSALEVCQKNNIIHRDIKPGNIFLSQEGSFKLGDFGVARIASASMAASTRAGTVNYMAPEVFQGRRYTSSVDIYSLGLVLYQLLNMNRMPFYPPPPQNITPDQQERARAHACIKTDIDFRAFGSDLDPHAIELTAINAKRARVGQYLHLDTADIADFDPQTERGTLVTNPPYGERMLDIREAERLYRIMGEKFNPRKGWSYGVISPDEQFEKCFGRKADKRRKLYNGMIKCQFYMYFK